MTSLLASNISLNTSILGAGISLAGAFATDIVAGKLENSKNPLRKQLSTCLTHIAFMSTFVTTAMVAFSILGANGVGCAAFAAISLAYPLRLLIGRFRPMGNSEIFAENLLRISVFFNAFVGVYSLIVQPSIGGAIGTTINAGVAIIMLT